MAEETSSGEVRDDAQRAASDDMNDVIDVTDADAGQATQATQASHAGQTDQAEQAERAATVGVHDVSVAGAGTEAGRASQTAQADQTDQVERADQADRVEQGGQGEQAAQMEPAAQAGPARRETRTLHSIDVRTAAKFGALLSGIVALMQSSVALMVYGVTLGRAGLVDTWAKGMLYAGRSVFGLLLMALVAAAIGGILWAVAAYLYNALSRATGGLRFTWD